MMAVDVPGTAAPEKLLPQLWRRERVLAVKRALPAGILLPHCSLSGDDELPEGDAGSIAVVVCFTEGQQATSLMSMHLQQWNMTFTEALRHAMKNLQTLTKTGPLKTSAERWETHTSGCSTTKWLDGSDAARVALLPSLAASRKRVEGDEGGVVALFASNHIALSAGSKNPLGLCYAGDVTNLQVAARDRAKAGGGDDKIGAAVVAAGGGGELLCASAWRLVKALADPKAGRHPLRQAAGPKPSPAAAAAGGAAAGGAAAGGAAAGGAAPGRIWKWIPYVPGPGEFSVPRDQSEVDAVLGAVEARKPVPVFGTTASPEDAKREKAQRALKLKGAGGDRFLSGDFTGALAAYGAALAVGELSDADAAKVHANTAACLLKLVAESGGVGSDSSDSDGEDGGSGGGEGEGGAAKKPPAAARKLKNEERAAKALRSALEASRLDPTYAKAYFRASQALELLGEAEAAAEAKAKADELTAAEKAEKQKEKEAREAAKRAKQEKKEKKEAAEREAKEQKAAAAAKAKAEAEAKAAEAAAKKAEAAKAKQQEESKASRHTITLSDGDDLGASLAKLGIPSSGSTSLPASSLSSSSSSSMSFGGMSIGGSGGGGIGNFMMPPQPPAGDAETFTLG